MVDARKLTPHDASIAARQLALARWGDTRPRRLAHELAERAGELDDRSRAELRLALAIVEDSDGGDAA